MAEVFVVIQQDGRDGWSDEVVGVYSTREQAERIVAGVSCNADQRAVVEPFVLDGAPHPAFIE